MIDEKVFRIKNRIIVIVFACLFLACFISLLIRSEKPYSEAERRPLAELPPFSYEEMVKGDYFDDFEEYALDQFIFRDGMRSIKAFGVRYLLGVRDNNLLYIYKGGIYKIERMNESSFLKCAEKIESLASNYDGNVYYSVIPDKNALVGNASGRPHIDTANAVDLLQEKISSAEYIEIADLLTLESYYKTDLHWKQEKILPVAQKLLDCMNNNYNVVQDSFLQQTIPNFYGVYYGQAALPSPSDEMTYLLNETLKNVKVTSLATGSEILLYNTEAFDSMDPYNLYLGGPEAILKIENPNAEGNRKLYLFRDSFGSSLAPLLIGGYSEIYLIDLRYVASQYLDLFVTFEEGNDMLFIYSNHILNESNLLR